MKTEAQNIDQGKESISDNSFYKNLMAVGIIIGGFYYMTNVIKTSINDTIAPFIEKQNEIKLNLNNVTGKVNVLEQQSELNTYKWSIYENQIKDFIKPREIEFKNREKK